ncbi:AgmX/PglI C-terminal domain-containing protein [Marinobacter sp. CA1]|uniref:AgmX/PglI C-terminal domain-containing protein n=1 Tax=Marinobacter sp. CA1 TaxID=2817656 RepID=UPI001D05C45E|nr:AgmX/PglI C-terminal domain-containing protein [Marinobacter sp. CA1]
MTEPPRQTVEQARERAASSGLLALQDQLASMQQDTAIPAGQLRANASDRRNTDTREPEKDVLASSGGVADTKAPQRSAELADHQVKSVTVAAEAAPARPRSEPAPETGDGNGERAMSNIRQVFDAQKNALYSLYRRELRQDPTLEGKILLELVIEPDGRVSKCEVVSSELSHPELETRLANRVRLFNFGADAVDKRTVRFPIEFLPS